MTHLISLQDLNRKQVESILETSAILKEKYGTFSLIKEGHRDEIYSAVLDDDPEAIDLFGRLEQELLDMGKATIQAIH